MADRLTDAQEVERVIAQCLKQRLEANAGTRPSGPTITEMAERVLAALPREVDDEMVPKARLEAVERELREVVERNTGGPHSAEWDGP